MLFDGGAVSAALFQWGVVLGASLAAALWDIKSRRIPNVLTLPLLGAGFLQAVMFFGWDGFKSSLFASIVLALPYVLLFLFAGGGAGDAKLMAGIGAWLGLPTAVEALVGISICAVILALLRAFYSRRFFEVLGNIRVMMIAFMFFVGTRGKVQYAGGMETADDKRALTMPYGPAIFAGLVGTAIYTAIVR